METELPVDAELIAPDLYRVTCKPVDFSADFAAPDRDEAIQRSAVGLALCLSAKLNADRYI